MIDKTRILIELSESDRTAYGRQPFGSQSETQQVFSSIWALESEVNNGGFAQYFANVGNETRFAPAALRRIGAERCALIVERALQVIPADFLVQSDEERLALFDDLPGETRARLDLLDRGFLAYPDGCAGVISSSLQPLRMSES